MQLTVYVSEISNTAERDLTFILNFLSESSIFFSLVLNSSC